MEVSLIYRTEPKTEKIGKKEAKTKTDIAHKKWAISSELYRFLLARL